MSASYVVHVYNDDDGDNGQSYYGPFRARARAEAFAAAVNAGIADTYAILGAKVLVVYKPRIASVRAAGWFDGDDDEVTS